MLLDTSILVELVGRPATEPIVVRILGVLADQARFASAIHLGELADTARRNNRSVEDAVRGALAMVELVPLTPEIAVEASMIKAEARRRKHAKDFSLIDGIGLASARSRGMRMLTMDGEFAGFPDVDIIDAPRAPT